MFAGRLMLTFCTAKEFRYTTAPLEPSLSDLVDTALLGSQAFHMLATPEEIEKPDS